MWHKDVLRNNVPGRQGTVEVERGECFGLAFLFYPEKVGHDHEISRRSEPVADLVQVEKVGVDETRGLIWEGLACCLVYSVLPSPRLHNQHQLYGPISRHVLSSTGKERWGRKGEGGGSPQSQQSTRPSM